jgi:hypothetical protein
MVLIHFDGCIASEDVDAETHPFNVCGNECCFHFHGDGVGPFSSEFWIVKFLRPNSLFDSSRTDTRVWRVASQRSSQNVTAPAIAIASHKPTFVEMDDVPFPCCPVAIVGVDCFFSRVAKKLLLFPPDKK